MSTAHTHKYIRKLETNTFGTFRPRKNSQLCLDQRIPIIFQNVNCITHSGTNILLVNSIQLLKVEATHKLCTDKVKASFYSKKAKLYSYLFVFLLISEAVATSIIYMHLYSYQLVDDSYSYHNDAGLCLYHHIFVFAAICISIRLLLHLHLS